MQDWTQKFNEARQAHGLPPVTTYKIVQIHEGMIAGCGCKIISATGKQFTIRHRSETCQHILPRGKSELRQVVGDGEHNAIGSVWRQPSVLPMTCPSCGLFPHEQERMERQCS